MSEALRTCVKPNVSKWEPTLEFVDSSGETDNTRLNRHHELKYEMEYDVHHSLLNIKKAMRVSKKKRGIRSKST